jgi:F0F1-type ATP synthase assembly protein I
LRRQSGSWGADASRGMNQASRGLAIAFGFVAAVVIFFFAGRLVDSWLGIEPWAEVVGSIIGWVAGVVVVFYAVQRPDGGGKG